MTTSPAPILKPEKGSLADFTEEVRKTPVIDWYRTPLSREDMKSLHTRSDFQGFVQTGGYLAILAATGATSIYSAFHWPWWATLAALFVHGTVTAFLMNGVHELGHGTVFKTKKLNGFFCHILAFLGWINHEMFQCSHTRHHRYTLHPPDDLEVVLPVPLMIRHVFQTGMVHPIGAWKTLLYTIRVACGRFCGEWELTLFPASDRKGRIPPVRWARILLLGHGTITIVSLSFGLWIVPVVTTLAPFYGGWLSFLVNNTQHIGLKDNVPDFRLCCRTFTLNPLVRFLSWQMNYHTEHHMYAAVPCYHLGRLHRVIEQDLPPTPHGLAAVWKDIAAILRKQQKDPSYQHELVLPPGAAPARLSSQPCRNPALNAP
ncbi:MAG: fatty acid desaturase [Terrimicrobiaceae bacterium]